MTQAQEQACRFVEVVAQCPPQRGNALDEAIVDTARKITAAIWRERNNTSRSGVPITRKN